MILAEVTQTSAIQIGAFVVAAAAVLSMIKTGRDLFVRQPPIEQDFVMKSEFNEFKRGVEKQIIRMEAKIETSFLRIGEKLDEAKSEILATGERRGQRVHERLDELQAQVARVDERTRGI